MNSLLCMRLDILITIWNYMFELPCYLRREYPSIPHSMMMKVDVHSACTTSLKWFCDCLLSGWWWWNFIDKKMNFTLGLLCHPRREYLTIPYSMVMKMDIHLACMCCKFEINLRLLAIWLVVIKLHATSIEIIMKFYIWAAVTPEQRVASSSSQHW